MHAVLSKEKKHVHYGHELVPLIVEHYRRDVTQTEVVITELNCILAEFLFFRQIIVKVSNIKFHANPPSGRRVYTCGRTDKTELTGSFATLRKPLKQNKTKIFSCCCFILRQQCSNKNRIYFSFAPNL